MAQGYRGNSSSGGSNNRGNGGRDNRGGSAPRSGGSGRQGSGSGGYSRGPQRDDQRSYGDRSQGERRPQRSYDDRGPRSYDRGDRPQGDRPQRSYDDRGSRGQGYGRRDDRGDRGQGGYSRGGQGGHGGRSYDRGDSRGPRREERRPRVEGPAIPDSVTGNELDKAILGDLRTLSLEAAEVVSRHLVMVQRLLDDRPDQAWEHAKAAVARGGRLAVVREAAGVAAYTAGEYADALAQFRAARRISGSDEFWPVMADCERGLGRPERAIAMAGAPEVERLDKGGRVEMRIVASGARRDLGQLDAAVVTLQCPELKSRSTEPWSARIKFAYADALLAAGREAEARAWFARADEVDEHEQTDAAERLAELDGLVWVDALAEDEDELDAIDDLDDDADDADELDDLEEIELGEESDDDDLDAVDVLESEVEALEERVEALEELVEELAEESSDAATAGANGAEAAADADVDPEDELRELLGEDDER